MQDEAGQVVGLYERHARAWARDRGTRLVERVWLERFRAVIGAGGAVLDLGCGSGEPIARHLRESGCSVTGIDAVADMIAQCRERCPEGDWRVADMRTLSLGRMFAGVLAWDSFFHLNHDDQRRMFPVFRSHAASGAALMFTSGTSKGVALGHYGGEVLYHASLDEAEYRALLAANGFSVVMHVKEDPDCGGRTVWLAQAG